LVKTEEDTGSHHYYTAVEKVVDDNNRIWGEEQYFKRMSIVGALKYQFTMERYVFFEFLQ
jgi:hypothetical protein